MALFFARAFKEDYEDAVDLRKVKCIIYLFAVYLFLVCVSSAMDLANGLIYLCMDQEHNFVWRIHMVLFYTRTVFDYFDLLSFFININLLLILVSSVSYLKDITMTSSYYTDTQRTS